MKLIFEDTGGLSLGNLIHHGVRHDDAGYLVGKARSGEL